MGYTSRSLSFLLRGLLLKILKHHLATLAFFCGSGEFYIGDFLQKLALRAIEPLLSFLLTVEGKKFFFFFTFIIIVLHASFQISTGSKSYFWVRPRVPKLTTCAPTLLQKVIVLPLFLLLFKSMNRNQFTFKRTSQSLLSVSITVTKVFCLSTCVVNRHFFSVYHLLYRK